MALEILEELARLDMIQEESLGSGALATTLDALVEAAVRRLKSHRVALILMDTSRQTVTHVVRGGTGWPQVQGTVDYLELSDGLSGWVLKTGRIAHSPKDAPDPRESPAVQARRRETHCGDILVAPLGPRERPLGTLTIINSPEQTSFSDEQVRTLEVFAAAAGWVIRAAITRDERDRARAEANAAIQSKMTFLANLSHELRTPLNGMLGFAQLLESTTLDDRQRPMIETILQSGHRLSGTIDNLLTLAQFETGQIELDASIFSPRVLLDTVAAPFAEACREKLLRWSLEVDNDVPDHLVGDPVRIGQAWSHVFSNAVKFTREGSVVVRLSYRVNQWQTRHLILTVEDSGIGLPEHQSGRWFKPFYQADGSLTRRFGGAGLGLALSDRIVRTMNGGLSLYGIPGAGTKARLWVETSSADDRPTDRPLKVLLQDHDQIGALTLVRMIEKDGHRVDYVASADEVLRRLDSTAYDAVLVETSSPLPHRPNIHWVGLVPWDEALPSPAEWSGVVTRPITYEKLKGALRRCQKGL